VQAFDKMLAMVAHHYPDECMDLVMEKTEHTLQSDHRSRHTYRDITSWLNVLKTIPSLEDQLKLFCQHLYDQYSRLRALREELQYTGLIRRK
jgi:proteasome lid subunit RPN8/RPN11